VIHIHDDRRIYVNHDKSERSTSHARNWAPRLTSNKPRGQMSDVSLARVAPEKTRQHRAPLRVRAWYVLERTLLRLWALVSLPVDVREAAPLPMITFSRLRDS
jgi:hypothetical protein